MNEKITSQFNLDQSHPKKTDRPIQTLQELAKFADYSLLDTLNADPDASDDGCDYLPRQVFSGHYVPVRPTPIENPEYITHSKAFFQELGLADTLATDTAFMQLFSGDISQAPEPMRQMGWACGYALSIFGSEYYQQCPFYTGNAYGDGRAISILEVVIKQQRWEMQLKGGGRTPYCRGADGRAVLRSSVREFLAQEHMHALGVPTSRSLTLYVSQTEQVERPWYSEGSHAFDPDILVAEPVAISTRVAPSFIRVGQLELFGRRARKKEHPQAMQELEMLVHHLIGREYAKEINSGSEYYDKVLMLAEAYRERLTALVANWIRVGYCQGNFNSDNCALGGFTLDYGPFGFCDEFHPGYQPWTGGGEHFAFLNQPLAAERNFYMFCLALAPLLSADQQSLLQLEAIQKGFERIMQEKMNNMWAAKLGLGSFEPQLWQELQKLMLQSRVDYTIFFRELSEIPDTIEPLKKSFYSHSTGFKPLIADMLSDETEQGWIKWHQQWLGLVTGRLAHKELHSREQLREQMKQTNPKYILREWFLAPAYRQARGGDYTLVRELQQIMTQPYAEQSREIAEKYYRLRPAELSGMGGVSHMSCSS